MNVIEKWRPGSTLQLSACASIVGCGLFWVDVHIDHWRVTVSFVELVSDAEETNLGSLLYYLRLPCLVELGLSAGKVA